MCVRIICLFGYFILVFPLFCFFLSLFWRALDTELNYYVKVRDRTWCCPSVPSELSTEQADEPWSISLKVINPVWTLDFTRYFVLRASARLFKTNDVVS